MTRPSPSCTEHRGRAWHPGAASKRRKWRLSAEGRLKRNRDCRESSPTPPGSTPSAQRRAQRRSGRPRDAPRTGRACGGLWSRGMGPGDRDFRQGPRGSDHSEGPGGLGARRSPFLNVAERGGGGCASAEGGGVGGSKISILSFWEGDA